MHQVTDWQFPNKSLTLECYFLLEIKINDTYKIII